jgi:EpsI family protein
MPMTKAFAIRLLIATGCVIATQIPAWQIERRTSADAVRARRFDVAALPAQLGAWTGVDTEIDERLVQHIGAFSTVNRAYENGQGRKVMVHLAVFPSAEVSLPHPPRLCYKNAGWKLGPDRSLDMEEKGDIPPFRRMVVDRDGGRAVIAYWYQLGNGIAADRGELRQQLQKYRWKGERWPPLVKVLLHASIDGSDKIAESDAAELGAIVYEWVRKES